VPAVKVSVVVPVFNPGEHVEACIASVLRQSLPAGEMEAIFVDDGSTDGTGERLDRLAAEHPDVVRVIHIPNSGWPGRPRNVGVDAAQGEFVLFVDNDDWIGDEALERLYATATRTGADVVVGKVVGRGKKVPLELFRRNLDDARLNRDPLLAILAPHKLFRRAFLADHELRFPEGRRRLEDHVMVVQAFFRARRIAVLSDYPTYFWVFHGEATNASQSGLGPAYFNDLREVLDIVEANTEPGAFRDRMLRHWYRTKMIGRLGGPTFAWRSQEQRQELFEDVRALTAERFTPSVTDGVTANFRVRTALMEAGRLDGLVELAEWETELRLELVPGPVRWEAGALRIPLDTTLTRQDKQPIVFPRVDGRLRYALPPDLPGAEAITAAGDVTRELEDSSLRVTIRARDTLEEYLLPVRARTELRETEGGVCVHVVGEAILDPDTAAAGTALRSAVWDLLAGMSCCGNTARRRIDAHAEQTPPAALTGRPARIVVPYRTKAERLAVDVDQAATRLLAASRPEPGDVHATVAGDALEVTFGLPVLAQGDGPVNGGELVLTSPTSEGRRRVTAPARLVPDGDHVRFEGRVPFALRAGPDLVSPGSWTLGGSVGHARPARLHLAVDVDEDGVASVRRGRGRAPVRPAAAEDFTALTRRYKLRRALRNFEPARRTVKRVRWLRNRLLGRPRKRHPGEPRPR
jgi:poly(ribitol-phosphate) beta-N-acetylglucosaminyltransferase